jgi:hypothetical protein
MALRNLPESALYNLLPAGIIELDQRGLIQALIGGIQDRAADIRSYVGKFTEFVNPTADFPELSNNVVLVTFLTPVGRQVTTSLDFQPGTPDGSDAAALEAWAASQLKIDEDKIVSAVVGTDALRTVDVQILSLLAENIGAVVYGAINPDEETEDQARKRAQDIVQAYFPQLKIKGTVESFSALGRLIGFDDVVATPLWTRLSPRDPADFGSPDNNVDFSYAADVEPTPALPSPTYDPHEARDGEFYSWTSQPLVVDPTNENYYLTVNKRNPFVTLVQTASPIAHPPSGTFVLAEGAPNRKAYVDLSQGTHASNMRAEALIPGEACNGLEVVVSDYYGTARQIHVVDQLSLIKYRSSWLDVAAVVDASDIGTIPAQPNKDLEQNPSLAPDGTAQAPFRAWSDGSHAFAVTTWPDVGVTDVGEVVARTQALVSDAQLDPQDFLRMQTAAESLEAVRPATRQIRSKSVGILVREDSIYAAYRDSATVFTADGSGSFGAILNENLYPAQPYNVGFIASVGTNDQAVYADQDGTIVSFAGAGFQGEYDRGSNSYELIVSPGTFASSGTLELTFEPTSSEVVRTEPTLQEKIDDVVSYQSRPEDDQDVSGYNLELYDEYPWRRQLTWVGGEDVDLDEYMPYVPDLETSEAERPSHIQGENGAEYEVFVVDAPKSVSPYRFKLVALEISDPVTGLTLEPPHRAWPLLAVYGDELHHISAIGQGQIVSRAYWSEARTANQAVWIPFNDHPVSKTLPASRGVVRSVAKIDHAARAWDSLRGWHLELQTGETSRFERGQELGDTFTFSLYLKPEAGADNQEFFRLSNGQVTLSLTDTALTLRHSSGGIAVSVSSTVTLDAWNYVAVRRGGTSLSLGVGSYWSDPSWTTADEELDSVETSTVEFNGGGAVLGVHDFGLWSDYKDDRAIKQIRVPTSVKTEVPYPSTWVDSVGKNDRFQFALMPEGGFAYPVNQEIMQERWRPGYVARYNLLGEYVADPRFKQVGLGDGYDPQNLYPLGLHGVEVEGGGFALITGSNPLTYWNDQFGTTPGSYVSVSAPYASDGGTVTTQAESPTPSVWPSPQMNTNPATDKIYVVGDSGTVYRVWIDDLGTGPELMSEPVTRQRPELERQSGVTPVIRDEPTDAHSVVCTPGWVLSVVDYGTASAPYAKSDGAVTRQSPPAYLYRQTTVNVDAEDAYSRWSNPNSDGQAILTATRDTDGLLQFTNPESLLVGSYIISFDVGNIGRVDDDFDGFSVSLSAVAGTAGAAFEVTTVLLQDGSGDNPRGTTEVIVTLATAITGPFLFNVDWTNSLSIPAKGQKRQIAIYGYTFRKIEPQLYSLELTPAITMTPVNMSGTLPPGSLYAEVNSYGTIVNRYHEALAYPEGSVWPMSNLLTGSTLSRREHVRVVTPFVEPDPTPEPAPVVTDWTAGGSPPYQFGQEVVLTANASGTNLRYVWSYWDGLSDVTRETSVTKVVTAGTGPFEISLTAVNDAGLSDTYSANLDVNQPPEVEVSATPDYEVFPYETSLSAAVEDPEAAGYTAAWYEPGDVLISSGTIAAYIAEEPIDLTFKAIDASGGRTEVVVKLSGLVNKAPEVSDIISVSTAKISTTNSVQFSVIAEDPERRGLTFTWTFWDGTVSSGTTSLIPYSSSYHNTVTKALSGSTPGEKSVELVVADTVGIPTTKTRVITLINNTAPTISAVKTASDSMIAGETVGFYVVAVDDDGDQLAYTWNFTSPVPAVALGGNAFYPTIAGQEGSSIQGTVTVTDGNGGSTTADIPEVALGTSRLITPVPRYSPGYNTSGIMQEFLMPEGLGITIRYTVDGTDVYSVDDGALYQGAFLLFPASGAGVITLKAKAFSSDPLVVASFQFEGAYTFYDPNATT